MEEVKKQTKKENTQKEEKGKRSKVLRGVVVSSKMKDTIVVAVTRYVKHVKYGKFLKKVKRYKVHDEGNTAVAGDTVEIKEVRPISKDKTFTLVK